jgi:hypothetical protein
MSAEVKLPVSMRMDLLKYTGGVRILMTDLFR